MRLQLGSRYGAIGIEVCDERGHVLLVVNRHESKRLESLKTHGRHGESPNERDARALETVRLEATAEPAIDFARELVRRWNEAET